MLFIIVNKYITDNKLIIYKFILLETYEYYQYKSEKSIVTIC